MDKKYKKRMIGTLGFFIFLCTIFFVLSNTVNNKKISEPPKSSKNITYDYYIETEALTTVTVTLNNDISKEQMEAIERLVSGCFNELPQDNLIINVNEKVN